MKKMPQPAYVICCALTADDPLTGSVSCVHLLETIQQMRVPQEVTVVPGQRVPFPIAFARIVATWMKSENDAPGTRFEVQNVLIPPGAEEQVIGQTEFLFLERS